MKIVAWLTGGALWALSLVLVAYKFAHPVLDATDTKKAEPKEFRLILHKSVPVDFAVLDPGNCSSIDVADQDSVVGVEVIMDLLNFGGKVPVMLMPFDGKVRIQVCNMDKTPIDLAPTEFKYALYFHIDRKTFDNNWNIPASAKCTEDGVNMYSCSPDKKLTVMPPDVVVVSRYPETKPLPKGKTQ